MKNTDKTDTDDPYTRVNNGSIGHGSVGHGSMHFDPRPTCILPRNETSVLKLWRLCQLC